MYIYKLDTCTCILVLQAICVFLMLAFLLKVKVIVFFIHSNCLVSCGFFLHVPHSGDHCFRQLPTLLHRQSQALNLLSPVLQASTWCHLSKVPPSIPFRSLLHLFFDGRKERCLNSICSCFLFLPAPSKYATFCIPCAELAGRRERGAKQFMAQQLTSRNQSK